jgi:hypothetical protein
LVRYPRAPFTANPVLPTEAHYLRDLAPPIATPQGIIFAPHDCDRIFACEVGSGKVLWKLPVGLSNDIVHLLGA